MMRGDEPTYIDYQSARTGRFLYDPVSLLYDPYVELPERLAEDLLKSYFEALTAEKMIDYGEKDFMRFATLSALQRLFKALGTYGYQQSRMGKNDYDKYIPVACSRIIGLLDDPAIDDHLADSIRPVILPFSKN
jgi:aminoglycoside/choline kinase family phosphotransferase